MGTGVYFDVPKLVSLHMDGMVGLMLGLGKVLACVMECGNAC